MINVRVLALALGLLPLTATFIAPAAHADELMKWGVFLCQSRWPWVRSGYCSSIKCARGFPAGAER